MRQLVVWVALLAAVSLAGFASEEGVLRLSTFTLQSEGIGESGPVTVKGTITESNKVSSLSINAFGKDYELAAEELAKIPAAFYNGIQLSYEEGYKSLGGKTIYIILQSGFTSGITKRALIALSENGDINIREIEK